MGEWGCFCLLLVTCKGRAQFSVTERGRGAFALLLVGGVPMLLLRIFVTNCCKMHY